MDRFRGARGRGAGFTGIEAAIVLAAVLVVGAFAAAATLWAGNFAASEGKASVDAAVGHATGGVSLRGSVLAVGGAVDVDRDDLIDLDGVDEQAVVQVKFLLTASLGGAPVDLTPPRTVDDTGSDPDVSGLRPELVISFRDADFAEEEVAWTVSFIGGNGDYILEAGERAEITAWLNSYDNANGVWDLGTSSADPYMDDAAGLLQEDTEFTLELHLPSGGVFTVQRVTPPAIETSMDLS